MDQRKLTNLLLLVIAVCLALVVMHLYGLSLAQPVEAGQKPQGAANAPLSVGFVTPQRVELVYQGRDGNMYSLANRDGRIGCQSVDE